MSKLCLAIDARCLNRVHMRGMGKYVWNVVTEAARLVECKWLFFGDRRDLPFAIPTLSDAESLAFEIRGHRYHLWEQYGLPAACRRHKADILHATSTSLPWWQPVPTVVTIHDTLPWSDEEPSSGPPWYLDNVLPRAFRKCAAIITISESSKRDILHLWPEVAAKVEVIPHGVDDSYFRCSPGAFSGELLQAGIQPPYLLYMGGVIPRKRLEWTLELFSRLVDRRVGLVICGVGAKHEKAVANAVRPELRDRVKVAPFIPEAQMPGLMQNAVALLYPTLYEGFGFPALEAQAVGIPVLFSAVGSLRELEGPSSFVLPADQMESWVDVCNHLVQARSEGNSINENARQWATRYSWRESARRHIDVYQRIARKQRSVNVK